MGWYLPPLTKQNQSQEFRFFSPMFSSVGLNILLLKTKWNLLRKLHHVKLRVLYTIKPPGKEGFSVLIAWIMMIIERRTTEKLFAPNLKKRRIQGMFLIASVVVCSVLEANKGIVNPIKTRLLFLGPLKIKFYITSPEKNQDQTR